MMSSFSQLMTSLYVYFIVLVAVNMAVCACPQQCSCNDVTSENGGLRVGCRGRALTNRSVGGGKFVIPAETEELDVGRNRISMVDWLATLVAPRLLRLYADRCDIRRIGGGAFRYFWSLEFIDLSLNHIDHLAREAFIGLPGLRALRLDSNRLEALGPNIFRGLTLSILRLDENHIQDVDVLAFEGAEVETLNLDGNRLVRIGGGAMRPLRSSLRNLTISRNAVPLEIEPDAFVGFSFTVVRVRSSGLQSVKFIEDVAAVESLNVGDNDLGGLTLAWSAALALGCREARLDAVGLERFDAALATSLRSARYFDLSANRLSDVDSGAFRPLADLRHLDLSRNQLTRLPPNFSQHISTVERLNLSSNSISNVVSSSLAGLTRLRMLDLSGNRIQVLPDALETVLAPVESFDVSDNPLHCNCELAWLRRWLGSLALASRHPDNARSLRCHSPGTPTTFLERPVSLFVCSGPTIETSTSSRNVLEGSDVVLACTAEADPTPNVKWASPFGDVVSVTPPDDRQQRRLSAIWQIRRARSYHSGWYSCNATSIVGSDVAYTYLHVFSPEVDSAAEMSGLVYPMIPLPVTSTVTTTSVTQNSTVSASSTPEPEIITTTGTTGRADPPRTSTLRHVVEPPDVTSSSAGDPDWMTSREGDENVMMMVIVAGVAGSCLLVFLVLVLVVFVVRRHRNSGKYDPSRPHDDDPRCWQLCVPCCPLATGRGSSEDPEFDTSTARLKLNTSALSATSTADRSFERPLTNGVTIHTDQVHQTLIGPPLTNDAQSR